MAFLLLTNIKIIAGENPFYCSIFALFSLTLGYMTGAIRLVQAA